MATIIAIIDGVQNTVNTAVDMYTSPAAGGGTRITSFTASLITDTHTYRVFIGATAIAAKEIIPATSMRGPDNDSPLGIIGHLVPAGEKIFVQISTSNTITIRATGTEL